MRLPKKAQLERKNEEIEQIKAGMVCFTCNYLLVACCLAMPGDQGEAAANADRLAKWEEEMLFGQMLPNASTADRDVMGMSLSSKVVKMKLMFHCAWAHRA